MRSFVVFFDGFDSAAHACVPLSHPARARRRWGGRQPRQQGAAESGEGSSKSPRRGCRGLVAPAPPAIRAEGTDVPSMCNLVILICYNILQPASHRRVLCSFVCAVVPTTGDDSRVNIMSETGAREGTVSIFAVQLTICSSKCVRASWVHVRRLIKRQTTTK